MRYCRSVGQMIPRVFHSEMDPSNHTKITNSTNSEARSQSLMMRKACRRNKTAAHCLSNNSLIKAIMELLYLKAKNSKIALLRKQKLSRKNPISLYPVRFALTYTPELRVTCSTFRIAAVVQKAGAIQNSADARQEYCS